MLAASQAYARKPRASWLFRVAAGALLGTVAASVIMGVLVGLEGVSRAAFAADALLFSISALGWRGAWLVRARTLARASVRGPGGELVDRTAEMTTLQGSCSASTATASC